MLLKKIGGFSRYLVFVFGIWLIQQIDHWLPNVSNLVKYNFSDWLPLSKVIFLARYSQFLSKDVERKSSMFPQVEY